MDLVDDHSTDDTLEPSRMLPCILARSGHSVRAQLRFAQSHTLCLDMRKATAQYACSGPTGPTRNDPITAGEVDEERSGLAARMGREGEKGNDRLRSPILFIDAHLSH